MKSVLSILIILFLCACHSYEPRKALKDYLPKEAEVVIHSQDLTPLLKTKKHPILSSKEFEFLNHLEEQVPFLTLAEELPRSLIAFTRYSDTPLYTFIAEATPPSGFPSPADATTTIHEKRLEIKEQEFQDQKVFYIIMRDGTFIASNSREVLHDLGNNDRSFYGKAFEQSLKAADPKKTTLLINTEKIKDQGAYFPFIDHRLTAKNNWYSIELEEKGDLLKTNGLSLWSKEEELLSLFKDAGSSPSRLQDIVPATASGFFSFSYKEPGIFMKNLRELRKDTLKNLPEMILKRATEGGILFMNNRKILTFQLTEMQQVKTLLENKNPPVEEYRGISINSLKEKDAFEYCLLPLISAKDLGFYILLDQFLVLASSPEELKTLISAFQTQNTLGNRTYFKEAFQEMATAANLLLVSPLSEINARDRKKALETPDGHQEPAAMLQAVADRGFHHLHGVYFFPKPEKKEAPQQLLSVELEAEILNHPKFIRNHLTHQRDIVVQDVHHVLYLISNKGDLFWKKQLEGPILGEIKEVDLLKNGETQLAFATPHRLEIIDRNGNPVGPFPLKFRDAITQPLSLFDYDRNRNYRFLITQSDEVFMYDRKGKPVKGFGFRKANATITFPPKHLRIKNRDYILISEETGALRILNRRGQDRIRTKKKPCNTVNPWFLHQGNFISALSSGEIVEINDKGELNSKKNPSAVPLSLRATEDLLVFQSENILGVMDQEYTLPFGFYTSPQILKVENTYYISITDLQGEKMYLFNRNAALLPGFPVFGTSAVDLSNADTDTNAELVVRGGRKEILLYRL